MHRYLVSLATIGCAGSPAVVPTPSAPAGDAARPEASAPARAPSGPYLGEVAGTVPTMFGRGIVSRRFQELNAAFSPSGDELFFTLSNPGRTTYTLVHMERRADGSWQGPVVAPFSGRHPDADPLFTADGKRLYFISRRPITGAGAAKDFDIWYVDKIAAGWGQPVNVGSPVNTPEDEYYVSITRTGTLYWSRQGDVLRGVPTGGSYRVEPLGAGVNTKFDEFDPYVAPDESYLIFSSGGRPDSLGSVDLYVSFRVDGEWQPARSLGSSINSKYFEYCPIVSPDGAHFFFTSYRVPDAPATEHLTIERLIESFDAIDNGMGNIYWMKADFLERMRSGGDPL